MAIGPCNLSLFYRLLLTNHREKMADGAWHLRGQVQYLPLTGGKTLLFFCPPLWQCCMSWEEGEYSHSLLSPGAVCSVSCMHEMQERHCIWEPQSCDQSEKPAPWISKTPFTVTYLLKTIYGVTPPLTPVNSEPESQGPKYWRDMNVSKYYCHLFSSLDYSNCMKKIFVLRFFLKINWESW